jgi:hypothetical protein
MLKRSSIVLAVVLVLGVSGCGGSDSCTPFTLEANIPAGMLLVGKPEEVFIGPSLGYAGTCRSIEGARITAAQIEVLGPDQQPVVFESSLNDKDHDGVTLRFTPAKVGRYHFFVAFDPIGGIQQFDLLAAEERASEPPLQVLPQSCEVLERTRSGAWLCRTNVFRGSAFLQQLPFGRMEVIGDVVWVVTSSQVLRYVDTGTKLELTASIAQPWGMPESLRATENDVAVAHASSIQLFTFDGSALSRTEPAQWPFPAQAVLGTEGPRGLLLRTGDRLAVVQAVPGAQGSFQACTFQLGGGRFGRTVEPCQTLEGFVVGFEPQAVWAASRLTPSSPARELRRLEWTGAELVEKASLALPETLEIHFPLGLFRSSLLPVLRPHFPFTTLQGRSAVPSYVPGEPLLRLMHMDAELSSAQATPSFFWGNVIDRNFNVLGTRIRALAPSP